MEQWRAIPAYPEYEASNLGRVRRVVAAAGATVGGVLKPADGGGRQGEYLRVSLSQDGKKKTWNVHVLVAIAWLGDRRAEGLTVDHRNDVPSDNRAENLRWITQTKNSTDGAAARWRPPPKQESDAW